MGKEEIGLQHLRCKESDNFFSTLEEDSVISELAQFLMAAGFSRPHRYLGP